MVCKIIVNYKAETVLGPRESMCRVTECVPHLLVDWLVGWLVAVTSSTPSTLKCPASSWLYINIAECYLQ